MGICKKIDRIRPDQVIFFERVIAGFKDFLPELPAIAEFPTGEVMGESADQMAARFRISRTDGLKQKKPLISEKLFGGQ